MHLFNIKLLLTIFFSVQFFIDECMLNKPLRLNNSSLFLTIIKGWFKLFVLVFSLMLKPNPPPTLLHTPSTEMENSITDTYVWDTHFACKTLCLDRAPFRCHIAMWMRGATFGVNLAAVEVCSARNNPSGNGKQQRRGESYCVSTPQNKNSCKRRSQ